MRVHTAWYKARIETIAALAGRTFVTEAKSPTGAPLAPPYVVIHPAEGTDRADRLSGPTLVQNPRWTIHTVGSTPDQAAHFAEQIKALVLVNGFGIVPVIAGQQCGRVWWSSPIPIQTDTDVSPAIFYHVAETGFTAEPA